MKPVKPLKNQDQIEVIWYNIDTKTRGILTMMTKNANDNRSQILMYLCIDDLVPFDHLLRQIDSAIDWTFIYDLV